MKYKIRVKTSSKLDRVVVLSNETIKVDLKAKAIDGKANEALIKLLSKYFSTPQSTIVIKRGMKSKDKVIEISNKL
jgi:hypothetical protein